MVQQEYQGSFSKKKKKRSKATKFVTVFVDGSIKMAEGMCQFSVYYIEKAVYTLCANPQVRAHMESLGKQIRSGNAQKQDKQLWWL